MYRLIAAFFKACGYEWKRYTNVTHISGLHCFCLSTVIPTVVASRVIGWLYGKNAVEVSSKSGVFIFKIRKRVVNWLLVSQINLQNMRSIALQN
jgi:hypothetical protein